MISIVYILMFLAMVALCRQTCFVAVLAPEHVCMSAGDTGHAELDGGMIAVFNECGALKHSYSIRHGHKYGAGGGMAEIDYDGDGIRWSTPPNDKRTAFLGHSIAPENVFFAL